MWRQSPALQFRPLAQHAFLIDQTQRRIEQLQQQADQILNKQETIELRIEQEDSKERRNHVLITELKQEIARLDRKEELVRQELLTLISERAADRAAERAVAAAATAPDGTGSASSIARHFLLNCITH